MCHLLASIDTKQKLYFGFGNHYTSSLKLINSGIGFVVNLLNMFFRLVIYFEFFREVSFDDVPWHSCLPLGCHDLYGLTFKP